MMVDAIMKTKSLKITELLEISTKMLHALTHEIVVPWALSGWHKEPKETVR